MEITIAIVSAFVALLALLVAVWQANEAKRAREVGALLPLYQTFESENYAEIRHKIRHAVDEPSSHAAAKPFEVRLGHDEEPVRRAYINHLNFVGIMIRRRLINKKDAVEIFGDAAGRCQIACWHYIDVEQQRNTEFAAALEELADRPKSPPTLKADNER